MRLSIAFRNILRNKRRTALNLFMVAGGVAGILLFRGFVSYLLLSVREGMIKAEYGHLQVATRAYWDNTAENPKDTLLPSYRDLSSRILALPEVKTASGRITFYGLLGAQERTVAARGLSLDPVEEKHAIEAYPLVDGRGFGAQDARETIVGAGLARQLGVGPGKSVTLIGYTYDSVVNALDLDVAGVFESGLAEIDNSTFVIPLATAQRLLDTDLADKIVVTLKETELTERARSQVTGLLTRSQTTLQIRSWFELSKLYRQVQEYYRTYNRGVESIILALVLIGILNTIGMSIFERTGEIGTQRAIGETRKSIVGQFVVEGALLGIFGALIGIGLSLVIAQLVNASSVTIALPGATKDAVIQIYLSAEASLIASSLAIAAASLAALVPALRATRMPIVDALRRNV